MLRLLQIANLCNVINTFFLFGTAINALQSSYKIKAGGPIPINEDLKHNYVNYSYIDLYTSL